MSNESKTLTTEPVKGEVWVWQPDQPKYRSVLIVTQVTRHMVRTKRQSGGRSFWNPTCVFLSMAQRAETTDPNQTLTTEPLYRVCFSGGDEDGYLRQPCSKSNAEGLMRAWALPGLKLWMEPVTDAS